MRPIRPFLALILLTLAFVACEDDGTGPGGDSGFSLVVQVSDPSGAPVEGLDVAFWNYSESLRPFLQDWPIAKSTAAKKVATRIDLAVSTTSVCDLVVRDLEDRVVQTLVDGDTLAVGLHAFVFSGDLGLQSGIQVFRYTATVRDLETGAVTYEDSKYMTVVEIDPGQLALSQTGADGRVRFDDPTLVPGLLELPSMSATDENGTEQGSFALGDTLLVRAMDGLGQDVERWVAVQPGVANVVELVWNPAAPPKAAAAGPIRAEPVGWTQPKGGAPETRLYQNFPNPFN